MFVFDSLSTIRHEREQLKQIKKRAANTQNTNKYKYRTVHFYFVEVSLLWFELVSVFGCVASICRTCAVCQTDEDVS